MKLPLRLLAVLLLLARVAGAQGPESKSAADPAAKAGRSAEAVGRRDRSLARLKADGIAAPADTDLIADSTAARLKSREEIAQRAVAVCLTALKAERAEQDTIDNLVKRYKAKKFFTPGELEFIETAAPTNEDRNKYLWRYEGLVALMWSLGYIENLDRPDTTCDVRKTVAPLSQRTIEEFIHDAHPRSTAEALDAADLYVRYQAVLDEARRHGQKPPANLERGVVQERQAMLSWLIGR